MHNEALHNPVTGHGGPQAGKMLSIPHSPHKRLTDGSEAVSLMLLRNMFICLCYSFASGRICHNV
jgi:hypothetical protein